MITEKIISVPIFRYKLKIVVFDTFEELRGKYSSVVTEIVSGLTVDYTDKAMVCVPPNDPLVVVHECEHVKNLVWQRIGFVPTPQNDEPDAYLLEYIYNEIMKVINKHLAT